MRVLVTGTAGRVGAAAARDFLEHGYTVRGLDKNPPHADLRPHIESVYVDLADRLSILKAVEGCEAIAHLAAIPSPGSHDNQMFETNVSGTQYILAAAEAHGIERVALASTCCTFGIFYALHQIDPQYLPMDEAHPLLPQDLYALSKVFNEETALAYTRRSGMTTTSLRLTTVMDLERAAQRHPGWIRHRLTDREHRHNDLWSYIDIKDAARAFRLAVENSKPGTNDTVIISARDSLTSLDIRELVQTHFPQFTESVKDLVPTASLYDTRRAEESFGFVAERHWRDFPGLTAAE